MPVPLIVAAVYLAQAAAGSWLGQQVISAAVSEGGKKLAEGIAKAHANRR